MRYLFLALSLLLSLPAAARVEVGIGISVPGIQIGINMPAYPRLVRVPGHPVYYDPNVDLNFFFYDGLYWVFVEDDWFVANWYDGPWRRVERYDVPVFVLRIPVRYYRRPPPYFRGWHRDAPPHWDEHWGREWKERRGDWGNVDRRHMPPPAPLPYYQRRYQGDRYPHEPERQRRIEEERYRYQPRDDATRRYYQHREEGRQEPRDNRGHDHR